MEKAQKQHKNSTPKIQGLQIENIQQSTRGDDSQLHIISQFNKWICAVYWFLTHIGEPTRANNLCAMCGTFHSLRSFGVRCIRFINGCWISWASTHIIYSNGHKARVLIYYSAPSWIVVVVEFLRFSASFS